MKKFIFNTSFEIFYYLYSIPKNSFCNHSPCFISLSVKSNLPQFCLINLITYSSLPERISVNLFFKECGWLDFLQGIYELYNILLKTSKIPDIAQWWVQLPRTKVDFEIMILLRVGKKKKRDKREKQKLQHTFGFHWISHALCLIGCFLFFMYALLSTNQEDLRESLDMSFIRFDVIEKKYWSVLLHIFFLNKVPNLKTELFSSLKIV